MASLSFIPLAPGIEPAHKRNVITLHFVSTSPVTGTVCLDRPPGEQMPQSQTTPLMAGPKKGDGRYLGSPLAWNAAYRSAFAVGAIVTLWLAVGWALIWWGTVQ